MSLFSLPASGLGSVGDLSWWEFPFLEVLSWAEHEVQRYCLLYKPETDSKIAAHAACSFISGLLEWHQVCFIVL